ncbi:MAG: S24 family peptidase [Candidatus Gracilibacteria bacterium]|nr:S24 family peptidase [Candidatus Gracilibacteria bacterium]
MITEKQENALKVISDYIARKGQSPTIEELQFLLEQKSKRGVIQYLEALEKKGFITRGRGYRSIKLGNSVGFQTMINIPLLGYANAGKPISFAQEDISSYIPISKNLIKGEVSNYFLLKIEGTSMNNFLLNGKIIENGSLVLVNKGGKELNNKDAFLFIIDNCATIKKYKKEGENIYLLPESKDTIHTPIILSESDDVLLNGKVVDVYNF